MDDQLLTKKLFLAASKNVNFLAFLLFILLPCFASAQASAVFGVTFGQPQDNGGECVGKGVCNEDFGSLSATNTYQSFPTAVTVTFQVSPNDSNILMMSFSLSELKQKQSAQVTNFVDSNTYAFGAAFPLAGNAFANMNLPANSQILPTSPNNIQINGDFVTVNYVYSHGTN